MTAWYARTKDPGGHIMASFEQGENIQLADASGINDGLAGARDDAYGRGAVEPHPGGSGDTNINKANANANANATGGDVKITNQSAFVAPPSFGGSECSEAKSGGLGGYGAVISYGESNLNGNCEQRKAYQAICGDANAKTALSLEALKVSASIPDTRAEHYAAQGIANDQATRAMDANDNCFSRMGIEHKNKPLPLQEKATPGPDAANYYTKQEVNTIVNRAWEHGMCK